MQDQSKSNKLNSKVLNRVPPRRNTQRPVGAPLVHRPGEYTSSMLDSIMIFSSMVITPITFFENRLTFYFTFWVSFINRKLEWCDSAKPKHNRTQHYLVYDEDETFPPFHFRIPNFRPVWIWFESNSNGKVWVFSGIDVSRAVLVLLERLERLETVESERNHESSVW